MVEEGADIIDIGGESTRPGAKRVTAAVQKERVLPVIEHLRGKIAANVSISIDTTLAEVAETAIDAGAAVINDISAGRDDGSMFALAAEKKVPIVLMHMQGSPETMQNNPAYSNVVEEIYAFLSDRIEAAKSTGIEPDNIIIDPGVGFGKTLEHNLDIIMDLQRFVASGHRVLLGVSRKRFLKDLCSNKDFPDLCNATCATTAIGVLAGVNIFRVHDVRENRQTADVVYNIMNREIRNP
jgi:dihydropteroate synthase